jgi:hypothetical protein
MIFTAHAIAFIEPVRPESAIGRLIAQKNSKQSPRPAPRDEQQRNR